MTARTSRGVALLTLACVLAGCGASDEEEVRKWMLEQRNATRPRVQPIPEPKVFTPQAYTQISATDPFSNVKLAQALGREASQAANVPSLITPELARRKEALEAFPLDSMTMVGSLVKQGQPVALLKVDNLLYQIRPGNYIGQNFGRVLKVGEAEIVLREIVQDAAGEWIERNTTLQLQERPK